jgi:CHAT domain-containing protein
LTIAQDPRAPSAVLLAMAPARPRLPFARQEVEALGRLFPGHATLALGADASETRFKRDAGRFRILHLATHGFFHRINPLFSGIDLERSGADDGRLQVYEILGLSLSADLVTLSACDTALGAGELTDLPPGEELVGLTRAFLSAGSRHVLATLWEVNDRATAAIMAEYYEAARSRSPAEALAQVQRRWAARAGGDGHPYYWAPFVLSGAGASGNPTIRSVESLHEPDIHAAHR